MCGGKRIKKVRRAFEHMFHGEQVKVRNVECYECPDCGERIYDPDAVDKVLSASPRRKMAVA
jgi:YgiT-type zinc finger domain-containing protein